MKPPDDPSGGTRELGDRAWRVRFHPKPARLLATIALDNPRFRPTLAALLSALRTDPKQFPTKEGRLGKARAAPLRFRTKAWRIVFVVDEAIREVLVLSIGPHDRAYEEAARRID